MVARGISIDFIEATLVLPDKVKPDPNDPGLSRSFKSIRAFGGRVLRVVHRPEGQDVFVVTAHWDRGAKR